MIDLNDFSEDDIQQLQRALNRVVIQTQEKRMPNPKPEKDTELENLRTDIRRLNEMLEDWKKQVQTSNRCLASELTEVRDELRRKPKSKPPTRRSLPECGLRYMGIAAILSGVSCHLDPLARHWNVPLDVLSIFCSILGLALLLASHTLSDLNEDDEEDF